MDDKFNLDKIVGEENNKNYFHVIQQLFKTKMHEYLNEMREKSRLGDKIEKELFAFSKR